jgi:N-acyl-D-amino-acid deacylase
MDQPAASHVSVPEPAYDLVIRNGTVVDGTGGEPFPADVAIARGVVCLVGEVERKGQRELDASGCLVTPGFVDIHTHYDGQATWENTLSPSSLHGVTTVVMGNCGVGFAPCRAESRSDLVRLMEGVEDIPEVVMTEGIPWDWQTFPEYLDFLAARRYDVDIAAQLPHAALRVYAMGARGVAREDATEEDMSLMRQLAREAIEAGALGFSTSRSINHRGADGMPTPSFEAAERELHAIAAGVADAGRGVLQVITDFPSVESVPERFGLLKRLAERSGRPLSFTLAQFHASPRAWSHVLELLEDALAGGTPIRGQVFPRPMGMVMGLETSRSPFHGSATYTGLLALPLHERVATLQRPEVRARILDESRRSPRTGKERDFAWMFGWEKLADYEPGPEDSIAARAAAAGVEADAFAYDFLLRDEGRAVVWAAFANLFDGSLEGTLRMLRSDATVVGLGDGGAHYGLICDASFPTFMLGYWGSGRQRGARLGIPAIVRSLSRVPALTVGLNDRGLIAPNHKADLNIIDLDALALGPPRIDHDLPAGGRRLTQRARGYRATIVGGQVTYADGRPTGALPGRLVRGGTPDPGILE